MITPDKMLLLLALFGCTLRPGLQPERYFQVLQATSQEWISGAPGGGRTTTYRLLLKLTTDKPIRFDSVWVAGKKLAVQTRRQEQQQVTLLASVHSGRPEEPDAALPPVPYQGAALLKCVVEGKSRYVPVPRLTALPTIYGQ